MCGIIGSIGVHADLASGLLEIKHRGPDATGVWMSPDGEFPVALGHQRLSIIDLREDANQPFESLDGRYILVYNGEIYNFIELRNELENMGITFRTGSDTEVLLNGLIFLGEEFLLKCNGMWSFCLWDRKSAKATFGRDRFGKKPLYYYICGSKLFFASEMKALLPFTSGFELSKDLDDFLQNIFDYEHSERCVISGIERLKAGYVATWSENYLNKRRWWNTLDHLVEVPKKYSDQVEAWRELFLDAVKIRMRSDVAIGTALSGGLDSSAVAASAHFLASNPTENQTRRKIQTAFCAHYPGSDLDEYEWAKSFADDYDIELVKCLINPEEYSGRLSESLAFMEDPYITSPIPMLQTYKAISENGIKVTLDGHGADELFSGYGHLSHCLTMSSWQNAKNSLSIINSLSSGKLADPKLVDLVKLFLVRNLQFISPINVKLRRCLKYLLKRAPYKSINYELKFEDQNHPAFLDMDPLNKSLYEIFHISILPTLLRNYDRYSMSSGVEIRMPFLDYRLVTYTFSLPSSSKIGDGYTKRILRDAMDGIMPDAIRCRRDKIGWNAPFHEWAQDIFYDEIQHMAELDDCPKDIQREWKRFKRKVRPNFNDGQKLWSTIMPYAWKMGMDRRYKVQ